MPPANVKPESKDKGARNNVVAAPVNLDHDGPVPTASSAAPRTVAPTTSGTSNVTKHQATPQAQIKEYIDFGWQE